MKKELLKKRLYRTAVLAGILFTALLYGRAGNAASAAEYRIPVGEGESKAAYGNYSAGIEGPMDFFVVDGEVFLLDSENERIMVYDGKGWVRNIGLGFYSKEMELLHQELFVVDYWNNQIVRFSLEGEEKEAYSLRGIRPEELKKLIWQDNQLKIITKAGQIWSYNPDIQMFFALENEEAEPEQTIETITYQDYEIRVRTQKAGDGYALVSQSVASDKLYMAQYLIKEDENGRPVGYFDLDWKDWAYIPEQYLYLAGDIPYIMMCCDEEVVIREIKFAEEYQSRIPELVKSASEGEKERRAVEKDFSGGTAGIQRIERIWNWKRILNRR